MKSEDIQPLDPTEFTWNAIGNAYTDAVVTQCELRVSATNDPYLRLFLELANGRHTLKDLPLNPHRWKGSRKALIDAFGFGGDPEKLRDEMQEFVGVPVMVCLSRTTNHTAVVTFINEARPGAMIKCEDHLMTDREVEVVIEDLTKPTKREEAEKKRKRNRAPDAV